MKVLLVDDHTLFLQSLKVLLSSKGYAVVGTAGDGLEALKQARILRPDLILMDIEMPRCDGLAATRLIKAEMPQIKIVMLTVSAADEHLFEAVKSGAVGYLLKSQSVERFLEMVAQVEQGGAALPPELAARLLEEFARQAQRTDSPSTGGASAGDQPGGSTPADLTAHQREILTLVAQGQTYPVIARTLHLSEATVRYHMGQIIDHLHLKNRAQVITYAARHGLS